ncbi:hypothetical protein FACS1894102_0380 [Spirochaetia bacterium]|nr:hypothetical protein FACS1894102_0380 [Spirochaetia bacterium]
MTYITQMRNILITCLFFTISLSGLFAQNNKFPRLEADVQIKNFATSTDNADWNALFDIAFWASTVDPVTASNKITEESKSAYKEKIKNIVETFDKELGTSEAKSQVEKAEYILKFLHKNIFTTYSLNQTRIDTLLTNGRFNCVSSAMMYVVLAKHIGLDPRGVITKDHAFVCLEIGGENIDIETTNAYGFDPGKRKDFHDDFGKTTGFAYTPPGNYRTRQTITQIELCSIILRNRIADLEKAQKYAEAVPLSIDRYELLKTRKNATVSLLFEDPAVELDNAIFNLQAFYLNKKRETDALAWADISANLIHDTKRLHEAEAAATNNLIVKSLRAGKISQAESDLSQNEKRLSVDELKTLKGMILDASLTELVNVSKNDEATLNAIKQLDTAGQTGLVDKKRIEELKQTVTKNRIAYFHNTFATYFNKKDFKGAGQILQQATLEFPGNKLFETDRKNLDKVQS